MEDEQKEEELTEEELKAMDSLFGFGGGCDCSHCDHGCHDEETEEEK